MQTKAYFANSVPAALEVARRELGTDALLVGSRPAPPDVRQFGRLEVTFAWNPKISTVTRSTSPIRQIEEREMDDIRCQLRALRSAVGVASPAPAGEAAVNWRLRPAVNVATPNHMCSPL